MSDHALSCTGKQTRALCVKLRVFTAARQSLL